MSYLPTQIKANTNSNLNDAFVKQGVTPREHILALRANKGGIQNVGSLIEQLADLCEQAEKQTGNIDYIDVRLN